MICEIQDRNIFTAFLSVFKNQPAISLSASEEGVLIECISISRYYLNIPLCIFNISRIDKLTINPSHLYNSIQILQAKSLDISKDYLKVFTKYNYIKIPFLSTSQNDNVYEDIVGVHTRIMVDSKMLLIFSNLKGLVKYEIEDGKFYIRKLGKNITEEVELKHFDCVEIGELSFMCNNSWTTDLYNILKYTDKVLFLFSSNTLSVQFTFKNEARIFFEIQIPKSIVEI